MVRTFFVFFFFLSNSMSVILFYYCCCCCCSRAWANEIRKYNTNNKNIRIFNNNQTEMRNSKFYVACFFLSHRSISFLDSHKISYWFHADQRCCAVACDRINEPFYCRPESKEWTTRSSIPIYSWIFGIFQHDFRVQYILYRGQIASVPSLYTHTHTHYNYKNITVLSLHHCIVLLYYIWLQFIFNSNSCPILFWRSHQKIYRTIMRHMKCYIYYTHNAYINSLVNLFNWILFSFLCEIVRN